MKRFRVTYSEDLPWGFFHFDEEIDAESEDEALREFSRRYSGSNAKPAEFDLVAWVEKRKRDDYENYRDVPDEEYQRLIDMMHCPLIEWGRVHAEVVPNLWSFTVSAVWVEDGKRKSEHGIVVVSSDRDAAVRIFRESKDIPTDARITCKRQEAVNLLDVAAVREADPDILVNSELVGAP